MAPKKEQKRYRSLFPEFANQRTPMEQRRYVQDEMVRLIESGDFILSELMNQRPAVKQIVGDVIFGHGFDDGNMGHEKGTHITSFPIPRQIANHQVEIEAVDGKRSIEYVDGSIPTEGIVVGTQTPQTVPCQEDNWIDLEVPRASVRLRDAWLILKRYGKYVTFAGTDNARADLWRYVEIEPKKKPRPEARA